MTFSLEADSFSKLRQEMVENQIRLRGIVEPRVLEAMLRVPRHEFVHENHRAQAYEDHPLPIGAGQTISQPYIVASMLAALELKPTDRVLEVGTGSGYVTALLGELAAEVFSIERHAPLAEEAGKILNGLGYKNVQIFVGDGSQGLPQYAPFDAITVAAAAPELPETLLGQLSEGGRMIVPVGSAESQQLQLIRIRNDKPQISLRELVRFVPLIPGE
jgi:protein-L-isoaspartate(D-aspartate) O-methyltransferase